MSETCSEMGNEARKVQGDDGKGMARDLSQNAKKADSNIDFKVYKGCDSNLDWALKYARAGFKVLPINYVMDDGFCSCVRKDHAACNIRCDKDSLGKHPVGFLATQGVYSATTDEETIKMWWNKCPNANIGLHAKNFVAMDIDKEEGRDSLLRLDKNNEIINPDGSIKLETPVAKSGRNEYGYHVLFKVPKSKGIPNKVKFEPGLDFRSLGGYIIVAPSNHISGNKYSWIKSIFEYELQEMPQWLIDAATREEVKDKPHTGVQKDLSSGEKIKDGERNSTLTSLAGVLRNKGLGFEEIKDSLMSINKNRCEPSLDDHAVETIAKSVCKYDVSHQLSEASKVKKPTTILIDAIEKLLNGEKDARLIFDSLGKPFLWIKMNKHFEMVELNHNNKAFKKFCFRLVKNKHGLTLKDDETFKNALLAIEVKAEEITENKGFELNPSNLGYRRTWNNGAAWYDLCNKDWTGIEIDENGYRKASLPPIFLRRGSESPQVEPVFNAEPEEIDRIFKYINVINKDKRLLIKSWLCASIVPMFRGFKLPQPILSFSGVTGSGKSVAAKFLKDIIDPSEVTVRRLPQEVEDLGVMLNRNGMVVFDNIGNKIPQDISDTLCIAATKGFASKRKLYTDDDEANLRLDSSIIFTSIQIGKMKDDLINRIVFIETSKFSKDQKRKRELILIEEFKKDLPFILGGIFASISEALKNYSDLDNIDTGNGEIRMLDFAIFGEALSRVWGNKEMKFFEAYKEMQGIKTIESIEESPTIKTLVSYMKATKSYYGPVGKLLDDLKQYYINSGMGTDTSYFTATATSFSKKLKERDGSLTTMGIVVRPDEKQTDGKTYYKIEYTNNDTQGAYEGQTSLIDDSQKGW